MVTGHSKSYTAPCRKTWSKPSSTASQSREPNGPATVPVRVFLDQTVVKEIPMSRTQLAFAVLVPLFWGLQFVVIKVGLTAFPPLFFVGLRFAAVATILLPFVERPTRRELGPMIAISVFFGGLNFGLIFVGLGQGLAGVSAVANQLSTPFGAERLGKDTADAGSHRCRLRLGGRKRARKALWSLRTNQPHGLDVGPHRR
jgi:hypothetical protein